MDWRHSLVPGRRPGAVLPHRQHRPRPPPDRGSEGRVPPLPRNGAVPGLGPGVRPGLRGLGRPQRGRASRHEAPQRPPATAPELGGAYSEYASPAPEPQRAVPPMCAATRLPTSIRAPGPLNGPRGFLLCARAVRHPLLPHAHRDVQDHLRAVARRAGTMSKVPPPNSPSTKRPYDLQPEVAGPAAGRSPRAGRGRRPRGDRQPPAGADPPPRALPPAKPCSRAFWRISVSTIDSGVAISAVRCRTAPADRGRPRRGEDSATIRSRSAISSNSTRSSRFCDSVSCTMAIEPTRRTASSSAPRAFVVVHAAGLQPQQGGDRLQVVLHPVVDLPDGRVLGHQLSLAAAQFRHVAKQHRRAAQPPLGLSGIVRSWMTAPRPPHLGLARSRRTARPASRPPAPSAARVRR